MTCLDERGRGRDSHGELWNGYYTQSYISEELASRWATTWIPDLSALSFVWTDLKFHTGYWIPASIWDFYFSGCCSNSKTKQKEKEKKTLIFFFLVNASQIVKRGAKVFWFIFCEFHCNIQREGDLGVKYCTVQDGVIHNALFSTNHFSTG